MILWRPRTESRMRHRKWIYLAIRTACDLFFYSLVSICCLWCQSEIYFSNFLPQFTIVEGKDGTIVKDADGNVVMEEEVKKSRKSNKEHQMVQKKKPKAPAAEESCAIDRIGGNDSVAAEKPAVVVVEEKKKKKSFFSRGWVRYWCPHVRVLFGVYSAFEQHPSL